MTQKSPSTSSSPAQDLEKLAEFIITSLKELSNARQVLTPASLAKALGPKRDFIHRLTRSTTEFSTTMLGGPKEPSEEADPDLARRALRAFENQQRLEKQLADLQQDADRFNEFYKKITLSLILLASESKSGSISRQLSSLRSLISSDGPMVEQERCLDELKTIILQEQLQETPQPDSETSKAPSFWTSWRKRP